MCLSIFYVLRYILYSIAFSPYDRATQLFRPPYTQLYQLSLWHLQGIYDLAALTGFTQNL